MPIADTLFKYIVSTYKFDVILTMHRR